MTIGIWIAVVTVAVVFLFVLDKLGLKREPMTKEGLDKDETHALAAGGLVMPDGGLHGTSSGLFSDDKYED